MTASQPEGVGHQQGRECPRSSDCELIPGRGCWTHMRPAPSPTPPARDSGRTVDGYGRNIGACTECHTAPSECTGPDFCCEDCLHLDEGWEGYETAPVESSGRDKAREAVARWLWEDSQKPLMAGCNEAADALLALPELAALLRESS